MPIKIFCNLKKRPERIIPGLLRISILIFVVLFFTEFSLAQTYYRMGAATNGSTVNFTCPISNTRFADDGSNSTHYSNSGDYTITFCAPAGKLLKFDFGCGSNLTIERIHNSDTLFAYDGNSTSAPLLFAVTGNSANTFRLPYFDETSVFQFLSPGNCITFRFKSSASNNDDGWDACITCVDEIVCGGNAPASDLFGGSPYICNTGEYCGVTSGDYGEDYPANLNPSGGSCPSTVNFAGTIENNSWIKFIASSTTAVFDFNVPLGGSCLNGIQTAVFSYNGTTLTRMTPCSMSDGSHSGVFQLTATGLTVGQTYYLMIDGNAGDICNYTINANNGVAVVNAGLDQTVCSGNSVSLSANGPPGATYTWNSLDGVVVNVSGANQTFFPLVNTSYVVTITGGGACSDVSGADTVLVNMCSSLPIILEYFSVNCFDNKTQLNWTTLSETGVDYFLIEKSSDGIHFSILDSVNAIGNSASQTDYYFSDISNSNQPVYYRLQTVDLDGTKSQFSPVYFNKNCSDFLNLTIFPNPAQDLVAIGFDLSEKSLIKIKILDVLAREIILWNSVEDLEPGIHQIRFDIGNLASGNYFLMAEINKQPISRLFTVIK